LIWHLTTCQRIPIPSVVGGRLKSVIFPFGGHLMFLGGLLHFCKGLSKWLLHMGRPSDGCITSCHLGQPSYFSNAHIYGSYLRHNILIKCCHNFLGKTMESDFVISDLTTYQKLVEHIEVSTKSVWWIDFGTGLDAGQCSIYKKKLDHVQTMISGWSIFLELYFKEKRMQWLESSKPMVQGSNLLSNSPFLSWTNQIIRKCLALGDFFNLVVPRSYNFCSDKVTKW
jgi:hypothetical protein